MPSTFCSGAGFDLRQKQCQPFCSRYLHALQCAMQTEALYCGHRTQCRWLLQFAPHMGQTKGFTGNDPAQADMPLWMLAAACAGRQAVGVLPRGPAGADNIDCLSWLYLLCMISVKPLWGYGSGPNRDPPGGLPFDFFKVNCLHQTLLQLHVFQL